MLLTNLSKYTFYANKKYTTMKKKIKTWLILLLGGVTEEESRESDMNSAYVGAYGSDYHQGVC